MSWIKGPNAPWCFSALANFDLFSKQGNFSLYNSIAFSIQFIAVICYIVLYTIFEAKRIIIKLCNWIKIII